MLNLKTWVKIDLYSFNKYDTNATSWLGNIEKSQQSSTNVKCKQLSERHFIIAEGSNLLHQSKRKEHPNFHMCFFMVS